MLFLQRIQVIPPIVYVGVTSMIGIAVILTLIVRARYTANYRDTKYWNRRRFAKMGGPPTAPTCAAIESAYDTIKDNYNYVQANLESGLNSFGNASDAGLTAFRNTFASGMTTS
jgi:hypothetical protein